MSVILILFYQAFQDHPLLLPPSKILPCCYISFLKKAARENKDRASFMHGFLGASLQLAAVLQDDGSAEGSHKPNTETLKLTLKK